eukprot:gnl/Dysnectes_brevis/876_a971_2974.p1 GENE.gnl/Dysnectes_brevis/876_a971_2974~~gnl/Dysnectes_brevis/876_a971_2974.p1  ORF type:complete len:871 (-),score=120.10 gnl/Dysnectes_brevis/876_a971_2974:35-2647(-)
MTKTFFMLALMLLISTVLSHSGVISIDLGSDTFKIGRVKPGTVENTLDIVLNSQSKRKSPSLIVFEGDFIYAGEAAINLANKKPKQALDNFVTSVDFHQVDMNKTLTALSSLISRAADLSPFDSPSVVLALPPAMGAHQRALFADAVEAADLPISGLISQPLAVALNHVATTRQPEDILILDAGSSSTSISLVTVNLVKEKGRGSKGRSREGLHLSLAWTRTVPSGGRDITDALLEQVIPEAEAAIGRKLTARLLRRLWAGCEKAKIGLTINPSARVRVDSLTGEIDFSSSPLLREELTQMVEDQLSEPLGQFLEAMPDTYKDKLANATLLMFGGASRFSAVSDIANRLTGLVPHRSVNADEAAALGAALAGALGMGGLRTRTRFELSDLSGDDIVWVSSGGDPFEVAPLSGRMRKNLSFRKQDNFTLTISTGSTLNKALDSSSWKCDISGYPVLPVNDTIQAKTKVQMVTDPFCQLSVLSASFHVFGAANETHSLSVDCYSSTEPGRKPFDPLSSEQIESTVSTLNTARYTRQQASTLASALDRLESAAYHLPDQASGPYSTEEEEERILELAGQAGELADRLIYDSKPCREVICIEQRMNETHAISQEIDELVSALSFRKREESCRPDAVAQLRSQVTAINSSIGLLDASMSLGGRGCSGQLLPFAQTAMKAAKANWESLVALNATWNASEDASWWRRIFKKERDSLDPSDAPSTNLLDYLRDLPAYSTCQSLTNALERSEKLKNSSITLLDSVDGLLERSNASTILNPTVTCEEIHKLRGSLVRFKQRVDKHMKNLSRVSRDWTNALELLYEEAQEQLERVAAPLVEVETGNVTFSSHVNDSSIPEPIIQESPAAEAPSEVETKDEL